MDYSLTAKFNEYLKLKAELKEDKYILKNIKQIKKSMASFWAAYMIEDNVNMEIQKYEELIKNKQNEIKLMENLQFIKDYKTPTKS